MRVFKRVLAAFTALLLLCTALTACGAISGIRQRFMDAGWEVDGNGYLGLKSVGNVRIYALYKTYADPDNNKVAVILEVTAGDNIEAYIEHLEAGDVGTEGDIAQIKDYLIQAKAQGLVKRNCLLVPILNADDAIKIFNDAPDEE